MDVTIIHYIILSSILFMIGVMGLFINRKSIISTLMAIELMLLAVNINFIAFSTYLGNYIGQIFVLFIIAIAAAEVVVGLGILIIIFKKKGNIWLDNITKKEAE